MPKPYHIPTVDKCVQFANYAPDTPIDTIGDVSTNLGTFVAAFVARPETTTNGAIVLAATESYSSGKMLDIWAGAQQPPVRAQFVRVGGDGFRALWPLWVAEMGVMMEFRDEYRERSWTDPNGAGS
ncbi:hypothetical protein B0T14DRAFT_567486 [Immersiella caudata]|uniref:Uncharacterized protein n=1 Tax=Immersiella caudata TaxID=314043 RepID=A0AA39WSP5_9PEZI|nr:hypothetical protein B0T14DRAFT_567486 [Immersiella caudata]